MCWPASVRRADERGRLPDRGSLGGGSGVSAARPCAVGGCVASGRARARGPARLVCAAHLTAPAFELVGVARNPVAVPRPGEPVWIHRRCVPDALRDEPGLRLVVVDGARIRERNGAAQTTAERATCVVCRELLPLAFGPRGIRRRRVRTPREARLW